MGANYSCATSSKTCTTEEETSLNPRPFFSQLSSSWCKPWLRSYASLKGYGFVSTIHCLQHEACQRRCASKHDRFASNCWKMRQRVCPQRSSIKKGRCRTPTFKNAVQSPHTRGRFRKTTCRSRNLMLFDLRLRGRTDAGDIRLINKLQLYTADRRTTTWLIKSQQVLFTNSFMGLIAICIENTSHQAMEIEFPSPLFG